MFFLFLHENICCVYSLEAPRRGTYECHNKCFHGEIIKKYLYFGRKSALSEDIFVKGVCSKLVKESKQELPITLIRVTIAPGLG